MKTKSCCECDNVRNRRDNNKDYKKPLIHYSGQAPPCEFNFFLFRSESWTFSTWLSNLDTRQCSGALHHAVSAIRLRCMNPFDFFTFLSTEKATELSNPVWGSSVFEVNPHDENIGEEYQGYNDHGNLKVYAKDW